MNSGFEERTELVSGDRYITLGSEFPTIVCLCGSTRFSEAFRDAQLFETLSGRIVLTIGCSLRSDEQLFKEVFGVSSLDPFQKSIDEMKRDLDQLHLRKIDLADEVLILNVGGYIGDSTRRELIYALKLGKKVRFLETGWSYLLDDDETIKQSTDPVWTIES